MGQVRYGGGCFCGRVRYVLTCRPRYQTVCYCRDCCRAAGAQAVAFVSVPDEAFTWTAERPKEFASSPPVIRTFCPDCGTSLTYRNAERGEIDVHSATLDDPEQFPPNKEFFVEQKLSWA